MMLKSLPTIISALLFSLGCQIGGQRHETADAMSSTVAVIVKGHAVCSATVIAPRLIVTAAHCLRGVTDAAARSDVGSPIRIVTYWTHPDYPHKSATHDVALALLENPGLLQQASAQVGDGPAIGDTLYIVGYHKLQTDTALDGRTHYVGTMRISAVGDLRFVAKPAPNTACGRDSGGPAFLNGRLIGIVVGGDVHCREYTEFLRLDAYQDFISASRAQLETVGTARDGAQSGTAAPR
jgi:secreted trypsin-like serine protease